MLRMKASACIEAPIQRTWEVLSDLEKISEWSEEILSATCAGDSKKGLGVERTCILKGNIAITEKILSWNEGESLTYQGFNIPMIAMAKNTWSVKNENGKTLLTTESEAVLKGGIFGLLFEPLIFLISKRMSRKTLAAFKFLVENGYPFEGKHSHLPKISALC